MTVSVLVVNSAGGMGCKETNAGKPATVEVFTAMIPAAVTTHATAT